MLWTLSWYTHVTFCRSVFFCSPVQMVKTNELKESCTLLLNVEHWKTNYGHNEMVRVFQVYKNLRFASVQLVLLHLLSFLCALKKWKRLKPRNINSVSEAVSVPVDSLNKKPRYLYWTNPNALFCHGCIVDAVFSQQRLVKRPGRGPGRNGNALRYSSEQTGEKQNKAFLDVFWSALSNKLVIHSLPRP